MSVLVYTENWDGKFKKASNELVSYGKAIAEKMGIPVYALAIGDIANDQLESLAKFGAEKVFHVKGEKVSKFIAASYTHAISEVAKKVDAKVVLFDHNYTGRTLAPRLAVRLDAGSVSGVVALPLNYSPFIVKRSVYTGKAFAEMQIDSDVKILSLMPNSFEVRENAVAANVEVIDLNIADELLKAVPMKVDKIVGKIPLTEADIIVSAGRGLKGPENWGMIEELATLLGAGTACSRPVSDEGWRGHDEHVGQTGKLIHPNLYIAIGISGAIQHLAGVNSSKVMVAINNDPEAPFFEAAHYGIVGDAFEVVPKLIAAVKEFKSHH
jgi:electron transfer flavoprotein alpha subunit